MKTIELLACQDCDGDRQLGSARIEGTNQERPLHFGLGVNPPPLAA